MQHALTGRLLMLVGFAAVMLFAGCPATTPNPMGKPSAAGGTDDPAAVEALKKSKATLETDSEGRIVKVDLDSAAGGDADLEQVKRLPSVRELDCTEVRGVTDAGLAKLAGLPALRVIKLERTSVTDAGMAQLQKIRNLEDLDLKRTGITAAGYKEVGKFSGLKRLRVVYNKFDDDCLQAIKDLKNLELLDMQDCNLPTEKGLMVLQGFPKLRNVRMYGPNINDKVIGYLNGAKDMRVLSLEQSNVTADAFDIIGGMSNLQELGLFGAIKTTDAAVAKLSGLKKLQKLELRQTPVTSLALSYLKEMKSLKSLDLAETGNVGDEGLEYIKGLTNLEELNLWQCRIDDKGLANLEGLTNLKWLKLDKCEITNDGLKHLEPLKKLEYLHIGSNSQITDAGLPHLYGLKKLKTLVVTFLPGVTDAGVEKLSAELPDAEIEQ
jgi:hypothetical protein